MKLLHKMNKRLYLNYAVNKNSSTSKLIYYYSELNPFRTRLLKRYKNLRRKFVKNYFIPKAQIFFNISSIKLWRTILKYRKYGRAEIQKFKK